MTFFYLLCGVVGGMVFLYLVVALLKPEMFP
ncbi:MAG: potassium-transporting ATPase subunit F [Alphaproteobacteria bacterium]|nr:potassium-transporting ATPase subunit F [Alphaproteobacteria bacterium]